MGNRRAGVEEGRGTREFCRLLFPTCAVCSRDDCPGSVTLHACSEFGPPRVGLVCGPELRKARAPHRV